MRICIDAAPRRLPALLMNVLTDTATGQLMKQPGAGIPHALVLTQTYVAHKMDTAHNMRAQEIPS